MNTTITFRRLPFFSAFLFVLSMAFLFTACGGDNSIEIQQNDDAGNQTTLNTDNYERFIQSADQELVDKWIVDMATHVLRKPDHASWETKFNAEFRPFYENKSSELEWIYALPKGDTVFFYLIRDGRDQRGKSNRGVGGKMVINAGNDIVYFEELFVTKIIDRINLESIGTRFMKAVEQGQNTSEFIQNKNNSVEWPDGRLFYSVQKSEWRYVD